MSGIYIPGIELPKDGWKTLRIYPTGEVGIPNWQGDCRFHDIAIPVPDHGRLIDADALTREEGFHDFIYENGLVYVEVREVTGLINAAPTIIPADGKDGAE